MKYIVFVCSILLLVSCEKNIDLNLHEAEKILVVDASIENNMPPVVVLTNSFDYYASIDAQLLAGAFIHDAEVSISDGIQEHKLKEYFVELIGGISLSYYSIDTTNSASQLNGQFNTSYNLKIISQGKEYIASTTIPELAKKPDSLWWKPAPFNTDTNNVVVMVKATDPPGLGNYIRYFTKKNNGPLLPGENSVYDDQVIDGSTYEIRVDPGIDRNNKISFDKNYFRRGDTVTLKLCNIDRVSYKFWLTMEFAYQSIGNPFASPNKVLGNISNGALGAFTGYAAFYKTIIIPQ